MSPADVAGANRLRPDFRLWLAGDDASSPFGQGRWQLLQAIEREGSLRAYDRFHQQVARAVERSFTACFKNLLP